MKISFVFLLLALSFCLRAQEPEWKFKASYGLGVTDYSEKGRLSPVKSDWSAFASDLMVEAQIRQSGFYPFIRVRLIGTEQEKETWKEQGVKVQENEMSMAGIDFSAGLEFPKTLKKGTLTYLVGLSAGYQSFEREKFVRFGENFLIYGPRGTVTEDVETYGVGGGVSYEIPMKDGWVAGAGTYGYWLFYTYANNDGFNTSIEGEGGYTWESSIWLIKALKNPNQFIGLNLFSDIQWTEGGDTLPEGADFMVEWPDSEWQHYSLSLFWRGSF